MSTAAIFEGGTPNEPGAALAMYRAMRDAWDGARALRWHVDPGNLGLLSRAVRELGSGAPLLEVVLRACDVAHDQTLVADEGVLAGQRLVRHHADRVEVAPHISRGALPYLWSRVAGRS